jgi:hypothetical protein
MTSSRQEREALLDLSLETISGTPKQRPEATIEAEFLSVMAYEVENGTQQLASDLAQASS